MCHYELKTDLLLFISQCACCYSSHNVLVVVQLTVLSAIQLKMLAVIQVEVLVAFQPIMLRCYRVLYKIHN